MNNNLPQRRTSLKDLARELGVSIATVSRALRNSPEIGAEMQKRVKDLAKKLNYRPNPFAQSLRKEALKSSVSSFQILSPTTMPQCSMALRTRPVVQVIVLSVLTAMSVLKTKRMQ